MKPIKIKVQADSMTQALRIAREWGFETVLGLKRVNGLYEVRVK